MPLKRPKPTSPGRRFATYSDFAEVTRSEPEKALTEGIGKSGGGEPPRPQNPPPPPGRAPRPHPPGGRGPGPRPRGGRAAAQPAPRPTKTSRGGGGPQTATRASDRRRAAP